MPSAFSGAHRIRWGCKRSGRREQVRRSAANALAPQLENPAKSTAQDQLRKINWARLTASVFPVMAGRHPAGPLTTPGTGRRFGREGSVRRQFGRIEPAGHGPRRSNGADGVISARRSLAHAQASLPAFRLGHGGYVALYQRPGLGQLRSWPAPQLCRLLRVELRPVVRLPVRVPSRLERSRLRR